MTSNNNEHREIMALPPPYGSQDILSLPPPYSYHDILSLPPSYNIDIPSTSSAIEIINPIKNTHELNPTNNSNNRIGSNHQNNNRIESDHRSDLSRQDIKQISSCCCGTSFIIVVITLVTVMCNIDGKNKSVTIFTIIAGSIATFCAFIALLVYICRKRYN